MSRKDYIATAEVIHNQLCHWKLEHAVEPEAVLRSMAEAMADAFAADNSAFDRLMFLAACGFNHG